jgi:hypothetical protein
VRRQALKRSLEQRWVDVNHNTSSASSQQDDSRDTEAGGKKTPDVTRPWMLIRALSLAQSRDTEAQRTKCTTGDDTSLFARGYFRKGHRQAMCELQDAINHLGQAGNLPSSLRDAGPGARPDAEATRTRVTAIGCKSTDLHPDISTLPVDKIPWEAMQVSRLISTHRLLRILPVPSREEVRQDGYHLISISSHRVFATLRRTR